MNRQYDINIRVTFERPLRVVLEIKSDAAEIARQTEKLSNSTDKLETAIADNQAPLIP